MDLNNLALETVIDGRYKILRKRGSGSYGVVYEAIQDSFSRKVALKFLYAAADADLYTRFHREAQILSALHHPSIASIYGHGKFSGHPYLVLQFVDGPTLDKVLAERKRMGILQSCVLISQAAGALAAAHKMGVVHRDIKPGNMLLSVDVTGEQFISLIDFGLSKILYGSKLPGGQLTQCGTALGSPLYMSPEQCCDRSVDARSDIYALGCVLYECFTGAPPLVAEDFTSLALLKLGTSPADPFAETDSSFGSILSRILRNALAIEPEDRYQCALDLQRDIDQIIAKGLPVEEEELLSNACDGKLKNNTQSKLHVEKSIALTTPDTSSKKIPISLVSATALALLVVCSAFPFASRIASQSGSGQSQSTKMSSPLLTSNDEQRYEGLLAPEKQDKVLSMFWQRYEKNHENSRDLDGRDELRGAVSTCIQNILLSRKCVDQHQYAQATTNALTAYSAAQRCDDAELKVLAMRQLFHTYLVVDDFKSAEQCLQQICSEAQKSELGDTYRGAKTDLLMLYWHIGDREKARAWVQQAFDDPLLATKDSDGVLLSSTIPLLSLGMGKEFITAVKRYEQLSSPQSLQERDLDRYMQVRVDLVSGDGRGAQEKMVDLKHHVNSLELTALQCQALLLQGQTDEAKPLVQDLLRSFKPQLAWIVASSDFTRLSRLLARCGEKSAAKSLIDMASSTEDALHRIRESQFHRGVEWDGLYSKIDFTAQKKDN